MDDVTLAVRLSHRHLSSVMADHDILTPYASKIITLPLPPSWSLLTRSTHLSNNSRMQCNISNFLRCSDVSPQNFSGGFINKLQVIWWSDNCFLNKFTIFSWFSLNSSFLCPQFETDMYIYLNTAHCTTSHSRFSWW